MNKGIIRVISVLTVFAAMTGCGSLSTQRVADSGDKPVVSAAEAESMIRVTVRTLEPTPGALTVGAPPVVASLD